MNMTSLAIASDHAGYRMKEEILKHLDEKGIQYTDLGAYDEQSSDYPDFGHRMGEAISNGDFSLGITICGSGNGINMVTNKHRGVRGAICWNAEISEMARRHNDANVCSLPARYIDTSTALAIVDAFLGSGFDGGRHERRKLKIDL